MNSNTRLLHLLFFLLRRPFNHWTDSPAPKTTGMSIKKKVLRWAAYKLLKYSRSKVFCVGVTAITYFRTREFPEKMLVNLPIFVEVDEDILVYSSKHDEIFARYDVSPQGFLISCGSRLIHEKGYDLLIKAISLLDDEIRLNTKIVIVGSGNRLPELNALVDELNLAKQVVLEKWLAIDDFKELIANSHVFVHPARFDSYGGTILGMALGVPVIGSTGAGAAVDRIEHGINGFLYEAEDIQALANFITLLYQNPQLRKRIGCEARNTALMWPPRRGLEILVENSI
jgi:glycosyltransferase involved in cell wall biosynthesis